MPDGVLDQRLQDHVGHGGGQRLRVGGDLHVQPVLKTHLLDGEIQLQILQLAAERDLLCFHIIQHTAQQIAQAAEHLFRLAAFLLPHQHHDGVQGVKQEMRLELHLQTRSDALAPIGLPAGRAEFQAQGFAVSVPHSARYQPNAYWTARIIQYIRMPW